MNTRLNDVTLLYTQNILRNVTIAASGIFLPKNKVSSQHLLEEIDSFNQYRIKTNWMSDVIGIKERRYASSNDTPSSMAVQAAQQALDQCPNINKDRIGKVVFCGIDKDQCEPATAHIVNLKLGLKAKEVYDISDACFGFMRGIEDCIRSIRLGETDYALVVTGERPSKLAMHLIEKMKKGAGRKMAADWIGFLTAGDAAGALLLAPSDQIGSGFGPIITRVNSRHFDKCLYSNTIDEAMQARMRMGHLTAHGIRMYREIIGEVNKNPGREEPDHVISHGTGQGSFEALVALKTAPREKWFKVFDRLGNVTSATFPVNYHLLSESTKIQEGQKIDCFFNGSGLVTGFREFTV